MKAVVAVPPILDFYFTPTRASALGAAAVAGLLRNRGMETILMNFPTFSGKPRRLPLPEEMKHIKDFIIQGEQGPLSYFSTYKRFGPAFSRCAEIITSENPEVLFISCFAWAYAQETVSLAIAVKEIKPEIIIAAGGAGVSVNPGHFEKSESIDHVFTGEAETALPGFLDTLTGRKGEEQLRGPDTTDFLIRSTGHSPRKKIHYYSAILTRGCPKSCRFCSNHLVHGRKFRKSPFEDVKKAILRLPEDENIHINFEDDNLLFAPDYFTGILKMIKTRFPEAEFTAENGLDYSLLTGSLLEKLINLGFKSFNLSMASTSQALLDSQGRSADAGRLERILYKLGKQKIASVTYFICGLENESPATVMDNLVYLHSLPTLTGISLFYPVPGIPSGGNDLNQFPPRLCAGSSAWPWTGSLSTAQMITAFRLSRLSNLIKSTEGLLPSAASASITGKEELLEKISASRKLHTIRSGQIIEVPNMDDEMVKEFYSRCFNSRAL